MVFSSIPQFSSPKEAAELRIQELAQRYFINDDGDALYKAIVNLRQFHEKTPRGAIPEDRPKIEKLEKAVSKILDENNIKLPRLEQNGIDIALDVFMEKFMRMKDAQALGEEA